MNLPLIGITVDNKDNQLSSGKYESAVTYSRAIALAGGLPLLLPQEVALAERYVELCDGILLTGGGDPKMEAFGVPTHPKAKCIEPNRQAFELALLDALDKRVAKPALGVCLGMQFMALHAGGKLNQHLPDTHPDAVVHQKDNRHEIQMAATDSKLLGDEIPSSTDSVVSWHRQAVEETGRLRLVATGPGAVTEAIDDPRRPFYVGVQWHPERGGEGVFNRSLLRRFVEACHHARK